MAETTNTTKSGFKAAAKNKASQITSENLRPLLRPLVEKAQPFVDRADQVLLGLSHSKESIPALLKQTLQAIEKNPNDIVGRVSRSVLERAETVRKQLIEKAKDSEVRFNKRWVPEWVKDVSFAPVAAAETKTAAKPTAKAKKPRVTKSAKASKKA